VRRHRGHVRLLLQGLLDLSLREDFDHVGFLLERLAQPLQVVLHDTLQIRLLLQSILQRGELHEHTRRAGLQLLAQGPELRMRRHRGHVCLLLQSLAQLHQLALHGTTVFFHLLLEVLNRR